MNELNGQLHGDLKAGRFISITFMLIDSARNELQLCAAGQFSPFHFDGKQWQPFELEPQLPLGILAEADYRSMTCPLNAGDFWLLFSDGITEARNAAGEEYSPASFLEALPIDRAASETIHRATEAWQGFVGTAPQHDDASLLLLDWRGQKPESELTTTCCLENLGQCRKFIERWADWVGYDDVATGQIVMACDEATSNIFRHAYGEKSGPIEYSVETTDSEFIVKIADRARGVDPTEIRGRELGDVGPGGLGTVVISQVFDRVDYQTTNQGTTLTLAKKKPGATC